MLKYQGIRAGRHRRVLGSLLILDINPITLALTQQTRLE
jgi:hypothetical protein